MNITTALALSALPMLRAADDLAQHAIERDRIFKPSVSRQQETQAIDNHSSKRSAVKSTLDRLANDLREFLSAIQIDRDDSIQVSTDWNGQIEVHGNSEDRQAIQDWMAIHPEWLAAWRNASRGFLETTPPISSMR